MYLENDGHLERETVEEGPQGAGKGARAQASSAPTIYAGVVGNQGDGGVLGRGQGWQGAGKQRPYYGRASCIVVTLGENDAKYQTNTAC